MNGGIVIVDDVTHPGWIGVRDGVGQFLAETSSPILDDDLDRELDKLFSKSTFNVSQRIIQETAPKMSSRNGCSRLVPFLLFSNKLFLTTPDYYPVYMEFLMNSSNFGNDVRSSKIYYLEHQVYRLTLGHVPIFTENTQHTPEQLLTIFREHIETNWSHAIDTSIHHKLV